ncbi:MAG: DUF4157 domain-containing protein [Deltaproteobacteria bacterium]|nr:DUF4157 domain-containing protein [Deltaproteobacteria bacterium]MCW5802127.1 DUF4157 domain-containing protein [Deltaproteobacteria bacterium]
MLDRAPRDEEAQAQDILAEREEQSSKKKGAGADARLAAQARQGMKGGGGALPHQAAIQRSFGAYDVSGIGAHVGGQAAEACDAIGAEAYASGDQVAFHGTPDLYTAAHEAAHVVQQRGGVQLKGGVGEEGDAHESHADQVAEKVVAGEPADYLLAQMAGPGAQKAGGTAGEGAVQMRPKPKLPEGEEGFDKMWGAHPHNNGGDSDTSSDEVREEHGLPGYIDNTCAVRLSIMLNGIGETITPAKTAAAGLTRKPHYSPKTKQYYILAAREMWTYLSKYFRSADIEFPGGGKRYKDDGEASTGINEKVKPHVAGKKGIVAFDKIFGYGGTGHVDLFDGETLSDSSTWYPSQRIMLWYIAVP